VRDGRDLIVELALPMVERERAPVVAGTFQVPAVFGEQRRDLGVAPVRS
jgi:hypothetical protein